MNEKSNKLEWAQEFFKNDLFSVQQLGAKIEAAYDGYARCSFVPEEKHQNAAGAVMGGAIFSLADFAFAVAANSPTVKTVSQSASIAFLANTKCKKLIAEASCIKSGKNICCYDILVSDDSGTIIAKLLTDGFIIDREELR